MSILYLYHILGIQKRSEILNAKSIHESSDFDSLNNDESEKQLKERLYEIKMKENRAAQHLLTDSVLDINSDATQA
jgi:hypothetical protein